MVLRDVTVQFYIENTLFLSLSLSLVPLEDSSSDLKSIDFFRALFARYFPHQLSLAVIGTSSIRKNVGTCGSIHGERVLDISFEYSKIH